MWLGVFFLWRILYSPTTPWHGIVLMENFCIKIALSFWTIPLGWQSFLGQNQDTSNNVYFACWFTVWNPSQYSELTLWRWHYVVLLLADIIGLPTYCTWNHNYNSEHPCPWNDFELSLMMKSNCVPHDMYHIKWQQTFGQGKNWQKRSAESCQPHTSQTFGQNWNVKIQNYSVRQQKLQ